MSPSSRCFASNLHWSLIRTSSFEARALLEPRTVEVLPTTGALCVASVCRSLLEAIELLEATDRDSRILIKV